jgi:hypothetical protein
MKLRENNALAILYRQLPADRCVKAPEEPYRISITSVGDSTSFVLPSREREREREREMSYSFCGISNLLEIRLRVRVIAPSQRDLPAKEREREREREIFRNFLVPAEISRNRTRFVALH